MLIATPSRMWLGILAPTTWQLALLLGIPKRCIAANLDRLADDGLLAIVSGSALKAQRSSLLRPDDDEPKKGSEA